MVSQLFVTVEKCPRTSQINDQINNVGLGRISLELLLPLASNPDLLVIFPHRSLCSAAPQGCLGQPVFSVLTPKQQNKRQQWECHKKNNPPTQFQIGLHVSLLSHYGFENLGERGSWVDDGQRFSTLLRHPVIRVTGCV